MEMTLCWPRLALTFGFIECFLFGGTLTGWSSLVYVLKDAGVFQSLCQTNHSQQNTKHLQPLHHSNITPLLPENVTVDGLASVFTLTEYGEVSTSGPIISNESYGFYGNVCSRGNAMLSLSFTLALVLCGLMAIPLGYLFDKFGLRYTRLVGTILATSGMLLIAFTGSQGSDWLIFPGIAFFGLSCVTIIMTNCHICLLAGRHSFTCIAIYNGAINMGAMVFLVGKIVYEAGFPLMYFMFCLSALWLLFVLTSTLFFMPKYKVEPNAANISNIMHITLASFTAQNMALAQSPVVRRVSKRVSNSKTKEGSKTTGQVKERVDFPVTNQKHVKDIKDQRKYQISKHRTLKPTHVSTESSIKQNMLSAYFLVYLWWYIVLYVRIQMFIMSYNDWLIDLVDGNMEKVSYFTNLLGYTQVTAFILAPFAGVYMDKKRQSISMTAEYFSSGSEALRGVSCVPSLMVASLSAIVLSALVLVPTEAAIYGAVIVSEVYRGFLYATAIAYIKIMFPVSQYGRLFGMSYLVSGAAVFLQYPLFLWVEGSKSGFQQVNVLLLVLACLTLVHPVFLLTSRYIQRK